MNVPHTNISMGRLWMFATVAAFRKVLTMFHILLYRGYTVHDLHRSKSVRYMRYFSETEVWKTQFRKRFVWLLVTLSPILQTQFRQLFVVLVKVGADCTFMKSMRLYGEYAIVFYEN